MKIPGIIRLGMLAGVVSGTSAGVMYIINQSYNGNQVYYHYNGTIQYRKVDGIYAHTIITKGSPEQGHDYFKLERVTLRETKVYLGEKGCCYIGTIIIKPRFFNDNPRLEYRRGDNSSVKEFLFEKADEEALKQFKRFQGLMSFL